MDSSLKVLFVIAICGVISVIVLRALQKLDVTRVLKIYCKDVDDDI